MAKTTLASGREGSGAKPRWKKSTNATVHGGEDGRVSQSAGTVLFGKGGVGYIARRGVDFGTSVLLQTVDGLARLATQQPLELLSLLPDVLPEVGLAAWNGLRLGCGPDAVKIHAVTVKPDGSSEEASDGTAVLDALWANQPEDVGNLEDCLGQNFMMMLFSGMAACEAVPGNRNEGLRAVYPVNSLTLRFRRDDDGKLNLYQRQTADPLGLGAYSAGMGGMFIPMPMERFFYAKMDGFPDDPYGRTPFAPALSEVLRTIAFLQSLDLAFKRVGMPRIDVGVDMEGLAKTARDVIGLTDPEAIREYVQSAFGDTVNFFNGLNPDDAFFHGVTDQVSIIGAGGKMPDVKAIYDIYRWRLIIALKQNPVLMGFVDGSTETWSDVQWEIYAKGTAAIVSKASAPLLAAANLHLRLLGLPYKAVAEYQPIRSVQRLADGQAEAVEIANEIAKVNQNWQLNDTASQKLTGSAPPSKAEIAKDTPVRKTAAPTPPPAPPENTVAPVKPKPLQEE